MWPVQPYDQDAEEDESEGDDRPITLALLIVAAALAALIMVVR